MPLTGILTIDTQAIANNWRLLTEHMRQSAVKNRCGAVVKANAYGLGVQEVAPVLMASGCKDFFVASLDEAIELRLTLGVKPKILVFGGLSHGCGSEWLEYGLIPILIGLQEVQQWAEFCRRHQRALPCALKADTGMHRLGVMPEALKAGLKNDDLWCGVKLQYFISHLACADVSGHPLNLRQLTIFTDLLGMVRQRFPDVIASLANSSGIFLGEEFLFDLGRPGVALYGGNPTPKCVNPMDAVVQLNLPVMQIRSIAPGEMVGYGATFTSKRETRLATVFGGYADGLFRCLSNRTQAFVGGQAVPLVGRVSMDSLIFDVTDLDVEPDHLTILNKQQTVDHLAANANTIGYEILTSLSKRYKRIYL